MEITAAMVMKLREMTGLPMMDCKKALTEAGGNVDQAIEILRKSIKGRVEKMADRVASEGRVAIYVDPAANRAGIVELRCETAPVASTQDFMDLANLLARLAAGITDPTPESLKAQPMPGDPSRTLGDHFLDVFNRIRENLQIARVASLGGHLGHYVHHDGRKGVLTEFSAPCPPELAADVCMHITAMRPSATRREDVDRAAVEKERQTAAAEAAGKPPAVVDKIVEGKLSRWFAEFVLLEQPFVKDDKKSVGQALQTVSPVLTVNRFLRYEVGTA